MFKPDKTKLQKAVIFLMAVIFVGSNFYFLLLADLKPVQATFPVVDAPQATIQSMWYAGDKAESIWQKVWDEVVAIFFKNILGTMANMIAQQSAKWVASGGKGGAPQFISDPNFWQDFADKAVGDFIQTTMKNLTGLDVCTLDPRLAINLAINIPFFPDWSGVYEPDCSWTQLRSHWEEIGQRKFEDFISFDYGIGAGGTFDENVGRLNTAVAQDISLRRWDIRLVGYEYIGGCDMNVPISGSLATCPEPPVQTDLLSSARALDSYTATLRADVEKILTHKVADTPADLSVGRYPITPENMPIIREAWLRNINPYISDLHQIADLYSRCTGKTACALMQMPPDPPFCKAALDKINLRPFLCPIDDGDESRNQATALIYQTEFNQKAGQVANIANAIKGGFEYLKNQIEQNFKPELLEGSVAYNAQLAAGLFDPSANEFNAYETLVRQMADISWSEAMNARLQAMIDQGWQSTTDRIAGYIRTPSNLIRARAEKQLAEGTDSIYAYHTKNIAADALGVFLQTLWNELALQLLDMLNPGYSIETRRYLLTVPGGKEALESFSGMLWNPFEELIVSGEGIDRYIQRVAQKFTVNLSFKDVNLLADFQLNIKGEANPNLYNNVIDQNFAIAINDKLTIKQALDSGKLVGDYTFSYSPARPGTYNLANIRKLRKARVVPLGLELAVQLIRDCNHRKTFNNGQYAGFQDINDVNPYGYDNVSDPFNSQRLQNCLFKPYSAGQELKDVRDYNTRKMNEVAGATLADVVDGFDKAGSGICGDFDENESPFCNLVNPNWVLKIPTTFCALQTTNEPFGELLTTNSNSQRQSRCPDFASCLNEDGKGSCINEDYGFCVKEKNVWQFATDSCPKEFNSCRTYSLAGPGERTSVSYLKNTLSGSDICGPYNAGCSWYSTQADLTGFWQNDARIYFNRYVEACDRQNEGCSEFVLYRNPANNLVFDSSFEYTPEGNFPAGWDLRLKQRVDLPADCQGTLTEICNYYPYDNQSECLINNGTWYGYCDDGESWSQAECLDKGQNWEFVCLNAINNQADEEACVTGGGEYEYFCTNSILKYNLCQNPQFTGDDAQEQCLANGGTWQQECEIGGSASSELTTLEDCMANDGSWREFCQGARLYDFTKQRCNNLLGEWRGEGPFSDLAFVSKDATNVYQGLSKLQVNIGALPYGEELVLVYKSHFNDETKTLTKAGDAYTATAYLKSNQVLRQPITFNLAKMRQTQSELNSKRFFIDQNYTRADSTIITGAGGTELDIRIYLPGGEEGALVYLDAIGLSINSLNQVRNFDFITPYADYEANNKLYYKNPPERLNCHGYGPGDPAPRLNIAPLTKEACEGVGGYWDEGLIYRNTVDCYKYEPDDPICNNFMKVCEAEEVGCQLFTPLNGDPQVPGVVSITDYCPAECVGYETYKQEPALYEPEPDPLFHYFIPETARSCSLAEVGCAQFTNLDEVARGGEGIGYYTYLRQCIKPNLGLGEKTFFTWQGSATGSPQLLKYEFQQDPVTGAPKTIDGSGDCRLTLSEYDLNCVNFFDSAGINYHRDIRKIVSVSNDCSPFRKTESTQANCLATNGRWQEDLQACIYDAIPAEAISCSAEANGCRTFIGNRGNNVYVQIFDTFEGVEGTWGWYAGSDGTSAEGLARVGESVQVGGNSLFVSAPVSAIHKPVNIQKNNLYTLSFWAKTNNPAGEVITAKFSTAAPDAQASTLEEFATLENNLRLTNEWRNYTLGPVLVSWDNVENNSLVFGSLDSEVSEVYFDNILLRVVRDNVYVVKNSWWTPDSCNRNIFGQAEEGAMLGCQAYQDLLGQTHNLKSFTNLCRESAIGCQILIDTKNSTNANKQIFNDDNPSPLDDYIVPRDELVTLAVSDNFICPKTDKGCQKFGKPVYQGVLPTFDNVYLKNDPDKYVNVPNAIMCNEESLGCLELINDEGNAEYFKIDPTKLCQFKTSTVSGENINGWFKKGSLDLGCTALDFNTPAPCEAGGGGWSAKYNQCVLILHEIKDQANCNLKKGEWLAADLAADSVCLAYPFTIYKVEEANKYKGFVGECDSRWSGCTEFIDINPNFVFNGSFESIDPTGMLSSWQTKAASSGRQRIDTDNPKLGNQAVKLIKTTSQNCPSTYLYPNSGCSLDESIVPSYAISQNIVRLEKGRTYKISFYYRVPEEAKGRGDNCPLPEVVFEFNSLVAGAEKGPLYVFAPESEWKKVEVLYTVPADSAEFLQDFELVLYAPLNKNIAADIGNCPDSYVLYDQVEIKDNTEDSYFVIDQGSNLDRSSCTSVNWQAGCVQFINTDRGRAELLKVKADRNCAEWAMCASYCSNPIHKKEGDCIADPAGETWNLDACTEISLCSEKKAGECVKFTEPKDNVRYDLNNEPLIVKRISSYGDQTGYIYRFGAGPLSALTQWRAGDYSGYTIPERFPLEVELEKGFGIYQRENNMGGSDDMRFVAPVCKVFPAQDSPMPYDLILSPDYNNLLSLYSQNMSLSALGNLCNYEEAQAYGTKTYFPRDAVGDGVGKIDKICTSPQDMKGKACSADEQCKGEVRGIDGADGECRPIEEVKEFLGLEGMCLEFDTLNPIYDGIYKDVGKDCIPDPDSGIEICTGPDYQPYACLTHFPFMIDLCPLYKNETSCELNANCNWQVEEGSTEGSCVRK